MRTARRSCRRQRCRCGSASGRRWCGRKLPGCGAIRRSGRRGSRAVRLRMPDRTLERVSKSDACSLEEKCSFGVKAWGTGGDRLGRPVGGKVGAGRVAGSVGSARPGSYLLLSRQPRPLERLWFRHHSLDAVYALLLVAELRILRSRPGARSSGRQAHLTQSPRPKSAESPSLACPVHLCSCEQRLLRTATFKAPAKECIHARGETR